MLKKIDTSLSSAEFIRIPEGSLILLETNVVAHFSSALDTGGEIIANFCTLH